ncbi:aprataxin-like protein [Drosophila ficusphila]|uniref:aprataxin-like protein n=1 Tax=Drosophila ficusphila TaxID=30025 RepID=UPI0007E71FC3|nr:aprataxin-like protein [Drosophila ficusphila]
MSWSTGLVKDMLKPENMIISSELGVVIADKFPKALHHYLVLPLADISSIFQLNKSHLPLLEELLLLARNVVEVKGVRWEDFQVGFHAEPSMQRLHLHVISTDFVSPSLKTKKHWNSFNTELFVPYKKLCEQLEKNNCFARLPKSLVDELLSKPLNCNQCNFVGKNLPTLKEHLVDHLQDNIRKRTTSESIKMEKDEKAFFRDELKRKLNDKRNFLIETDRAVVIKADFPKSQYHFRVVAKEELGDVTKITGEQLPLLDHMMELANQIIEKQEHLESVNFRIGFKVHTFWNRLNLHVISDDFYSMAMKRPRHWNSFNTEIFMPFQMVHMMLSLQGSIEPMSEEKFKELQLQRPLRCNQCDFSTELLLDLKAHLYHHWQRKEGEREHKKKMEKIIQKLDEAKLDTPVKPAEPAEVSSQNQPAAESAQLPNQNPRNPFQTPQQLQAQLQAENGYSQNIYGPPVNMMNLQNPNNPFRNTPSLNIQSMNPPQPNRFNYRPPGYRPRGPMQNQGPRAHWNGPRFPPRQQQNVFRHPGASPPMNFPGAQPYPIHAGPSGQPNGPRPKWVPQNVGQQNQQYPNQHNQQNSNHQQPNQNRYQPNRPQRYNPNQVNRQNPDPNRQNPQPNRQNPDQNRQNPNNQNQNQNKKAANQKNQQQSSGKPQNQAPPPANNSKPAGTS